MGNKHKHYDVIVAWAAGKLVQFYWEGEWNDYTEATIPRFIESQEWRIKPKTVKKEGWVNVYRPIAPCVIGVTGDVHRTKEEAESCKSGRTVACIRIEWEEENNVGSE